MQAQQTASNTDQKRNKKEYLKRCTAAILLVVVIALGIMSYENREIIERHNSNQCSTLGSMLLAETLRQDSVQSYLASCDTFDINVDMFYTGLSTRFLDSVEITPQILQTLNEELEDGKAFFIDSYGAVIAAPGTTYPHLETSVYDELHQQGYSVFGKTYTLAPYKQGSLLIEWEQVIPPAIGIQNRFIDNNDEIFFTANSLTGEIYASDNNFAGTNMSDHFGSSWSEKMKDCGNGCLGSIAELNTGKGTEKVYLVVLKQGNNLNAVYMPLAKSALSLYRSMAIQTAMFITSVVCLLIYALMLLKSEGAEQIPLFGKLHIHLERASHLSGLLVFCLLLSVSLTLYSQLLIGYSERNVTSNRSLSSISAAVKANDEASRRLQNYYSSSWADCVQSLAWLISQDEIYRSKTGLYSIKNMIDAEEITLFDEYGTSEITTSRYTGYRLAAEAESAEYALWQILWGSDERVAVTLGDDQEIFAVGVRRMDAPGLLLVKMKSKERDEILSRLSVESSILAADISTSQKYYGYTDAPKVLYTVSTEGQSTAHEVELPEAALVNGYAGIQRLFGNRCYINTMIDGDRIFLCADRIDMISTESTYGMLVEVIGLISIYFVLLLITSLRFTGKETVDPKQRAGRLFHLYSNAANVMDKSFRKVLSLMMAVSGIVLVLILLGDSYYSDPSLMSYLFSTQWNHGLNLFSFTMILMTFVGAQVGSLILQKLILLVGDNTGPGGATVGHLLSSLVRFGMLAAALIYSIVLLGADLHSLLTGAGFAGAAIALCARGIVDDFVNGIFIVIEGKFRVGDWVTVGDWRGQVMEIGVRTTSISKGGVVKVFNNSSLNGIVVGDKASAGAICEICIAYEEDVDKVMALITANNDRYLKENPHITGDLKVLGVTGFGANGVDLKILAPVDNERYVNAIERSILKITKQLFDENGIVIPYPQMVVHQAETK